MGQGGERRRILVLDGHDATGKTTLARRLAAALGAAVVRPFAGDAGRELLARAGDPARVAGFARETLAAAATAAIDADAIVFDRHWMTVCSLLPESSWAAWLPPPPTALCWADLPTTLARLRARADEPDEPVAEHARYLERYDQLGRAGACLIVRTDRETEDRSLERLIAWGRARLDRHRP